MLERLRGAAGTPATGWSGDGARRVAQTLGPDEKGGVEPEGWTRDPRGVGLYAGGARLEVAAPAAAQEGRGPTFLGRIDTARRRRTTDP